ncbi:MAG: trypsin-like serine protease [Saprospiraceae bacterium]
MYVHLFIFLVYTIAPVGVIRHGIDKTKCQELASQSTYLSVGMFTQENRIKGSCVLLGPRIALTAAHTLLKTNDSPLEIEFGNQRIKIDSFKIHPLYFSNKGADIALLYLSQSIENIPFPRLNKSKKELNHIATSVGFGNFSVANNPRDIVDAGRLKSAGQNILDSIAGTPLANGLLPFVYADFDNPDSDKMNKSGSSTALPLEYGLDGGDSGGGMFIRIKGKEILAGINAIQNKNIADILRTGTFYGSSSEWVRISVFRKWIIKESKKYNKINHKS